MLFQARSGEGIEVGAGRKKSKLARGMKEQRILRDRAMFLLRRFGNLTYDDIKEVAQAFRDEPITDVEHIADRIRAAESFAEQQAKESGLLCSD